MFEDDDIKLVLPNQVEDDDPKPEKKDTKEETTEDEDSNLISLDDEDTIPEHREEEPEEPEETENTAEEEPEDKPNVYKTLLSELVDEGILEESEDDITSADDLKAKIKEHTDQLSTKKKEEWMKNLSPEKKLFLDIEEYFDDSTQAMQVSNELTYFENLQDDAIEEDDKIQDAILERYYRSKGITDPDEIKEHIEQLDALDKKSSKAVEYKSKVVDFQKKFIEKTKESYKAREDEEQQSFSKMVDAVDTLDAIIPDAKLTEGQKKAIKKGMTEIVHEDETGKYTALGKKQLDNPQTFEHMMQYYNTLGLFDMDDKGNFKPDMKKLIKLSEKKVRSSLDEMIQDNQKSGSYAKKNSKGIESAEEIAKKLDSWLK